MSSATLRKLMHFKNRHNYRWVILIRHLGILSLALFFCLFSQSLSFAMGSRPPRNAVIKGQVISRADNKPIKAALIKVSTLIGRTVISTLSDNSGNYNISKSLSGAYLIQCSASGYQNMLLLRFISQGQTYTFNFNLNSNTVNNPPKIISFTPQSKFSRVSGENIVISITAQDPDNDPLYYKYSIDNNIIQDWTVQSSLNYKTSNKDLRRHTLKVEVKDSKNASTYKTTDFFVFMAFPKPGN